MKEQCYQYTTDLLVIGCGFSGMWAAMRARDFLGDVLVVVLMYLALKTVLRAPTAWLASAALAIAGKL